MGSIRVNNDKLRDELRKQLNQKYREQDQEINMHNSASVRIDTEIFDLKQRLLAIDEKSLGNEVDRLHRPIRQSAGLCINPKCHKRIYHGQSAIKYGHGLCCNWKCFSETLVSKT